MYPNKHFDKEWEFQYITLSQRFSTVSASRLQQMLFEDQINILQYTLIIML